MNYVDTAFAQLHFAIKLMQAAESGVLDLTVVDTPLTIHEGGGVLVLPDRIFSTQADAVLACQNLVSVAFGAAAITLNRCREEMKIPLPDPINGETDQWIALVYQIRNAFAHDISEPKWEMRDRYRRQYAVRHVTADLTNLHGQPFSYHHIGGPDALILLREYARDMFGLGN